MHMGSSKEFDRALIRGITVADKYKPEKDAAAAICKAMQIQFKKFYWNCLIVEKDFDSFAIGTLPPDIPMVEAKGPNGEKLFIWALNK